MWVSNSKMRVCTTGLTSVAEHCRSKMGVCTADLASVTEHCRHLQVLDLIENDVDDEEDKVVDWMLRFRESLVFDCVGCPVNFEALVALVARSPFLRQLLRLMAQAPRLTHLGTGSFRMADAAGQGGWDQQNDLGPAYAAFASPPPFAHLSSMFQPHLPELQLCGDQCGAAQPCNPSMPQSPNTLGCGLTGLHERLTIIGQSRVPLLSPCG